jgi:phosphoenolpyruvate carboxylase
MRKKIHYFFAHCKTPLSLPLIQYHQPQHYPPNMETQSFKKFVTWGLSKSDQYFEILSSTFVECLKGMQETEVAANLEAILADNALDLAPATSKDIYALSILLQLMNLAEEYAANVTRKKREESLGLKSERSLWGHTLEKHSAEGIINVSQKVSECAVDIVFTKHPTEAKRWPVIAIHREIYNLLKSSHPSHSKEHLIGVLERLWRTGELFFEKPSVDDELNNLLFYLEQIFPKALRLLDRRFIVAWKQCHPNHPLPDYSQRPKIRFGSWVGGDRDGHPLVTAKVTLETVHKLRKAAFRILQSELESLEKALSFVLDPQAVFLALPSTCARLNISAETLGSEPLKALLSHMRNALPANGIKSSVYPNPSSLMEDLGEIANYLDSIQAGKIRLEYVEPVMRLVDAIGFHLASLDIRQNSKVITDTVSELLVSVGFEDAVNFDSWSEDKKCDILQQELANPRPFCRTYDHLSAKSQETLDTFRLVAEQSGKWGAATFGKCIVSMTRSLSDLLCVYVIGKETGLLLNYGDSAVFGLPLVPLFETEEDLKNSLTIIPRFLDFAITKNSIRERWNGCITIMLGYSDSNKDSGIVASHWVLHEAQLKLVEVCRPHKVACKFFHGRGGTISRGAGPTHRFLEALPEGSLSSGIRLTEQGEVIAQKYNNLETAVINLEYLTSGLYDLCCSQDYANETPAWREGFAGLAKLSSQYYRKLIQAEGFISFFRESTPISVIEQSRIGSRPSRRTGANTLEDLRAIPWVFSWNQSRFFLPGWYGVGSAIEALREQDPDAIARLADSIETTPFLRYLFYNIEISLMSTDPSIYRQYAGLLPVSPSKSAILSMVDSEYERTLGAVRALFHKPFEERRPRLVHTLKKREFLLKPLHQAQLGLLKQWFDSTTNEDQKPVLLQELLTTVNAIANGLRATG